MSSPYPPNMPSEDYDLTQTIAISILAVAFAATYLLQPSIPDILPTHIDLSFHRFAFLTTIGWNIPAPQPLDVLLVLEELAPPQIPSATPSIPKPPSYTTSTSTDFEPPLVLNITLIIACYAFLTTIGLYYALRSRPRAHGGHTRTSIPPASILAPPCDERPTSVPFEVIPQETGHKNVEVADHASQLGDILPGSHEDNDSDLENNDSDESHRPCAPSTINLLTEGDPGEERRPLSQHPAVSPEPLDAPSQGSETPQPNNDGPEISVLELVPDSEPEGDSGTSSDCARKHALVAVAPLESDIEDADLDKSSTSLDVMAVNLNAGIHSPTSSHFDITEAETVLPEVTDAELELLAQRGAPEQPEPFVADDHPAPSPLDTSTPYPPQDTPLESPSFITSYPASDFASEDLGVSVHDQQNSFTAVDSNLDSVSPVDESLGEDEVFVYSGVSLPQPELSSELNASTHSADHSEELAAATTALSEPLSVSSASNDIPSSPRDLSESILAPAKDLFDDDFWLPRSGGLRESIHAPPRDHNEPGSTAVSALSNTIEPTWAANDDEGVAASMHAPRRNVSSGLGQSQGLRSSIHAPSSKGGLEPKLNTPIWKTSNFSPQSEALNESKLAPARNEGVPETQTPEPTHSHVEFPQLSTNLPETRGSGNFAGFYTGTSEEAAETADEVEIWTQAFKLRRWARDPKLSQSRPPSRSSSPEPPVLRRRSSSLHVGVGRRSPSPAHEAEVPVSVPILGQESKKRSRRSKRGGVRERQKQEARQKRNRKELEEAMIMDSGPEAGPSLSSRPPTSDVGPNWQNAVLQDRQISLSS